MKLRLCNNPVICAYDAAAKARGEKLLPIIIANCPCAGKGPGGKACYPCVEKDPDTGLNTWEYICLEKVGCKDRGEETVRFRELVPHDVTNVKKLIECGVTADEAFTQVEDAEMVYRRCTLDQVEPAGKMIGGSQFHHREETVEVSDGVYAEVVIELKKQEGGVIEEIGVQGSLVVEAKP